MAGGSLKVRFSKRFHHQQEESVTVFAQGIFTKKFFDVTVGDFFCSFILLGLAFFRLGC